jgi:hypothetical protein
MTFMKAKRRASWLLACAAVLGCGSSVSNPPGSSSEGSLSAPGVRPTDAERNETSSPSFAIAGATPDASQSTHPTASLDPIFQAMIGAVAAHRPTFRFSFGHDRLEGDWRLDGVADDGTGPGRLYIDLTREPGAMTANPCGDPDFVQGGRCSIQLLPTGSTLVRRGLVEANGTRTVLVGLIHPNRSGITVEASNLSIGGRAVSVSRSMPLYTVEDLADLVVAIDDRVQAIGAS